MIAPINDGTGDPICIIDYVYATANSPTQVTLEWSIPTDLPNSYRVKYSTDNFVSTLGSFVINGFSNNTKIITGLTSGTTYQFGVTGYYGNNATGLFGATYIINATTPLPSNVGGVPGTPSSPSVPVNSPIPVYGPGNPNLLVPTPTPTPTPGAGTPNGATPGVGTNPLGSTIAIKGNAQVSRSLFCVSSTTAGKASLVYKDLGFSTTSDYYMFGTTIFFDAAVTGSQSAGGIGFFTGYNGGTGYYIELKTTDSLSSKDDKEVKIWKHYGDQRVRLADSQKGVAKSFNGLYGGSSYKVDIKLKRTATKMIIDLYVNGLKITASDTTVAGSTDPMKIILPKTSGMVMFSSFNKTYFDYIYAIPIDQKQYDEGMLYNIYSGQLTSSSLKFLYGEKVLDNLGKSATTNGVVEEFGTVARELRKVNVKFNSRPGYPLYPTVGVNNFIEILGSKMSNFGAEVYLLNNSGIYVALSDSDTSSFSIIGNYISSSGEYEYVDTTSNEYDNPEPATFDSTWIQTEGDAKYISNWIKNQWSKQQYTVTMQIFGNPLISVGDIVTVNYPINNLDGTQKFVVTNVTNSYQEGIETTVTCRSIYS